MALGRTPFRFTMAAHGDVQVDRQLLRIGMRAAGAKVLFEDLAEDFMNLEYDQFNSQGGKFSGGWAPLAESTVKRKGHDTILYDTGALKDSLTVRGAEGQILVITRHSIRFGTSISYAGYHQTGTVNMPQRRIIEFSEFYRVAIIKKVQLFLLRGVVAPL